MRLASIKSDFSESGRDGRASEWEYGEEEEGGEDFEYGDEEEEAPE